MNLLVTGGTGKLGIKLLWALKQFPDIAIRVMIHRTPLAVPGIEIVEGDVADPVSFASALEGADTVLHLAALTHSHNPEDYFRINTEGTANLIKACEKEERVKRFVFMSSRAARPGGGAYSKSKYDAEAIVKQSKLNWTILQPSEMYGAGSDEALSRLIDWVESFSIVPVIGDGEYLMSPVHIEDIVSATVNSLVRELEENFTFVLAGPENMSFNQLVDRLSDFNNLRRQRINLPVSLMNIIIRILSFLSLGSLTPDQIPRLLCPKPSDITLARHHLSFHPRKLEEGLRST